MPTVPNLTDRTPQILLDKFEALDVLYKGFTYARQSKLIEEMDIPRTLDALVQRLKELTLSKAQEAMVDSLEIAIAHVRNGNIRWLVIEKESFEVIWSRIHIDMIRSAGHDEVEYRSKQDKIVDQAIVGKNSNDMREMLGPILQYRLPQLR